MTITTTAVKPFESPAKLAEKQKNKFKPSRDQIKKARWRIICILSKHGGHERPVESLEDVIDMLTSEIDNVRGDLGRSKKQVRTVVYHTYLKMISNNEIIYRHADPHRPASIVLATDLKVKPRRVHRSKYSSRQHHAA